MKNQLTEQRQLQETSNQLTEGQLAINRTAVINAVLFNISGVLQLVSNRSENANEFLVQLAVLNAQLHTNPSIPDMTTW